jgi:outer membrane protein OmpA-like peptidoglycan-associated protein
MKTKLQILLIASCMFLFLSTTSTFGSGLPEEIRKLYDSTKIIEAHIFAPKAYEKAEEKFNDTRDAIAQGKKQSKIEKLVNESHEYAENVFKIVEVTRLSLSEYLDPRNRAIEAEAPKLVSELYQEAEEQFLKASRKVEAGDVEKGLQEADRSTPLFDFAELKAIKVEIMGAAASLIDKADEDEARKYAPTILDKARSFLTKCDNILDKDRYNRIESIEMATTAEYEARHASNIAQSIRAMERNDQAWEKLILLYEIEMQSVADELTMGILPFDNGPSVAADSMIIRLRVFQKAREDMEKINADLAVKLAGIAAKLGVSVGSESIIELAEIVDKAVVTLISEKKDLASKLQSKEGTLAELTLTHEQVESELNERKEEEEKLKKARRLLNPTEGEILYNATNDIVLRLSGLSFSSGASDIEEKHVDLLKKVEHILEMLPNKKLLVEGHTDDRGERSTNMQLSDRRAFSVMQYFRKTLSISADQISAVGYGPDKPIGTNTTKSGRAKNRRIDIIVFQ